MARPRRLVKTRPTDLGRARGLVSSRRSGQRVGSSTHTPPDDLREVVDVLWTARWDLRGQEPHVTELLANPSANLVFERSTAGEDRRLVGVWTRLWRRTLADRGTVRGARLRPGALGAFVDRPAVALANRIVPLDELFGPGVAAVATAVLAPEDDAPALAALAAWLRAIRRPPSSQGSLATAIAQRIADDLSITTVERLAEVSGLGPRSLERLFREHVGASPKWVIRRNRLQEAALRLERADHTTLAALAAELGYTDQAHLARDFRSAVGRSPSEFAATVNR